MILDDTDDDVADMDDHLPRPASETPTQRREQLVDKRVCWFYVSLCHVGFQVVDGGDSKFGPHS